jgi:hypothetical protein
MEKPPRTFCPKSMLNIMSCETVYATDEDVAIRASADYFILVPKHQKLAWGDDGRFEAGNRWVLSSATVDFEASGLMPGHLMLLTQPRTTFKPPGESFAIHEVTPSALTLRRKGLAAGTGQPPSPAEGLSRVEFLVATFGPQIASASYDLNRRFGIDDLIAGRRPSDLFDPKEVREATVLTLLHRQYLALCRGPDARNDLFATKAQLYKQELDDLLARTVVHWAPSTGEGSSSAPCSRFGTRLSR